MKRQDVLAVAAVAAVTMAFTLVAFGRYVTPETVTGQVVAAFTIAVAAAETTVALAIVLLIYQHHRGIDIDKINFMKW